jgi:hypothetical protein
MQRTFITIGIVCSGIMVTFQSMAFIARFFHDRLVRNEISEAMEDRTTATTATLLKPLAITLPIIGSLLALQRAFTGVTSSSVSICLLLTA